MGLPDPREKPTLSVSEVSEILGWGRSAVYDGVRRGDIPSLRVGRRIRVPTARLHDMLGIGDDSHHIPLAKQNETAQAPTNLGDLLAEAIARGIELAHERGHI
jgi:excisionase family DNA binding protein